VAKAKLKSFIVEIYGVTVFYSISSFRTFKQLLQTEFNYELPEHEKEGGVLGFTMPLEHKKTGTSGLFVWLDNKNKNINKIKVHESFHAAENILFSRDITLGNCSASREAYAYLIAHIFNKLK
jgi:hypothetical protein